MLLCLGQNNESAFHSEMAHAAEDAAAEIEFAGCVGGELNYFGFARFNHAVNFKVFQCEAVPDIFASYLEPDFITLLNSNYIGLKFEFSGGHFDHAHAGYKPAGKFRRRVGAAHRFGIGVSGFSLCGRIGTIDAA